MILERSIGLNYHPLWLVVDVWVGEQGGFSGQKSAGLVCPTPWIVAKSEMINERNIVDEMNQNINSANEGALDWSFFKNTANPNISSSSMLPTCSRKVPSTPRSCVLHLAYAPNPRMAVSIKSTSKFLGVEHFFPVHCPDTRLQATNYKEMLITLDHPQLRFNLTKR